MPGQEQHPTPQTIGRSSSSPEALSPASPSPPPSTDARKSPPDLRFLSPADLRASPPAQAFVEGLQQGRDVSSFSAACLSAVSNASALAHACMRRGLDAAATARDDSKAGSEGARAWADEVGTVGDLSPLLDRSASSVRAFAASRAGKHNRSMAREALFDRTSTFRAFAEAAHSRPSTATAERDSPRVTPRAHVARAVMAVERRAAYRRAVLAAGDDAARTAAAQLGASQPTAMVRPQSASARQLKSSLPLEVTRAHIERSEAARRAAKEAERVAADEEARAVLREQAPPAY